MAYLIGVPLLALLTVVQSSVLGWTLLLDGRPDLVLLAVVSWALTGRSTESMVWGLIGGLFLDLYTGLPYGLSAVALILVAFVISSLLDRFWEGHLLTPLGAILIASLFFHFTQLAVVFVSGRPVDLVLSLQRVMLPSSFLNLALALPAKSLADGLNERLSPPEVTI
jgi:rod shape-determining protein MreD